MTNCRCPYCIDKRSDNRAIYIKIVKKLKLETQNKNGELEDDMPAEEAKIGAEEEVFL